MKVRITNRFAMVIGCIASCATCLHGEMPVNGSFENALDGWAASGNVSAKGAFPYRAADGGSLVAFNSGNRPPNGILQQRIPLHFGRGYRLEFDAGVLPFAAGTQKLGVKVSGAAGMLPPGNVLIDDAIILKGTSVGRIDWTRASYGFTPDRDQILLEFTDLSTSTVSLDLLLDHVTITELPPGNLKNGGFENGLAGWTPYGTISIKSAFPYQTGGGGSLLAFNAGDTDPYGFVSQAVTSIPGTRYRLEFEVGNLSYLRSAQNMQVQVQDHITEFYSLFPLVEQFDVPGDGSGRINWISKSFEFTASTDFIVLSFVSMGSNTRSTDLVLDHVRLSPVPPQGAIANGSFEWDFNSWQAGGNVSVKQATPYLPTDGNKLIAFNSANTTPDGWLSQDVAVVPGRRLRLEFDVGNLSLIPQPQKLHVQVLEKTGGITWLPILDVVTVSGSGDGSIRWLRKACTFVPKTDTVTITFSDVSGISDGLDLLLDNVQLLQD